MPPPPNPTDARVLHRSTSGRSGGRTSSTTLGRVRIEEWVSAQGGIVHREAAIAARFSVVQQRAAVREGALRRVRRSWLATLAAPPDLLAAAAVSGRVACVSVARRRGWWMPPDEAARLHLALPPTSSAVPPRGPITHWTQPIAPVHRHSLEESVEDALAHIARCLSPEGALAVWEDAIRRERLSVDAVRRITWPSVAARECADRVSGLSDSGLETVFVFRLRHLGVRIRQQVVVAGRRVDALVGDRLIAQVDGFEHHSTSAQRTKDVAHDAELRLRGYTVFRFTYSQILYDWPSVERTVARAIAARLHVAA